MAGKTTAEIERHYFEQFRQTFELPSGRIEYADKPDVLLIGEQTIGIEITKFYRQPGKRLDSEQQQRQLRIGILSDAQDLYWGAGGRQIEVSLGFDAGHPITTARRKSLPQALANLVHQVDSRGSGQIERSLFQTTMPELSAVYLNATEYDDASWQVVQSHRVELMSVTALEEIVRDKEAKSAEYAKCDSYWLLVVVDWTDAAQEQEIRVDDVKISSGIFEKIIVYKPNFEHVVEVQR